MAVLTAACAQLLLLFTLFAYALFRFIDDTRAELLDSKWVQHVQTQQLALEAETKTYAEDFPWLQRSQLALDAEMKKQLRLHLDAALYVIKVT